MANSLLLANTLINISEEEIVLGDNYVFIDEHLDGSGSTVSIYTATKLRLEFINKPFNKGKAFKLVSAVGLLLNKI